jgi:hypothetical protein
MPTSLPLMSRHPRPTATIDFQFWFLVTFPIVGLVAAVLLMSASAGGVSSAVVAVAGAGI